MLQSLNIMRTPVFSPPRAQKMALCKTFHFIHIGKTGGTAVKNMVRERASSLVVHEHVDTFTQFDKI